MLKELWETTPGLNLKELKLKRTSKPLMNPISTQTSCYSTLNWPMKIYWLMMLETGKPPICMLLWVCLSCVSELLKVKSSRLTENKLSSTIQTSNLLLVVVWTKMAFSRLFKRPLKLWLIPTRELSTTHVILLPMFLLQRRVPIMTFTKLGAPFSKLKLVFLRRLLFLL